MPTRIRRFIAGARGVRFLEGQTGRNAQVHIGYLALHITVVETVVCLEKPGLSNGPVGVIKVIAVTADCLDLFGQGLAQRVDGVDAGQDRRQQQGGFNIGPDGFIGSFAL